MTLRMHVQQSIGLGLIGFASVAMAASDPMSSMMENLPKRGKRNSKSSLWSSRKGNVEEEFQYISHISDEGQTAQIFKVQSKKDGKFYAAKRFEIGPDAQSFDEVQKEARIMEKVKDLPNVVELKNFFEDKKHNFIYFIMGLHGKDLFDALADTDTGKFSESRTAKLVEQMIRSLREMHNMNIGHFDLKLANFVVESCDETGMPETIKMIDFGFSEEGGTYSMRKGTPLYMAPEILAGHYNKSVDMWAIGVMTFWMVFAEPPFGDDEDGSNAELIYRRIEEGSDDDVEWMIEIKLRDVADVSDACIEFIQKCLTRNPEKRMTAEDALGYCKRWREFLEAKRKDKNISWRDFPSIKAVEMIE